MIAQLIFAYLVFHLEKDSCITSANQVICTPMIWLCSSFLVGFDLVFTTKHFLHCKKLKNREAFNTSFFVCTVLLMLSHFISLTEPSSTWSWLIPLEKFPNTSGLSLWSLYSLLSSSLWCMQRSWMLLLLSQWALVTLCSSPCGCEKDFQRTRCALRHGLVGSPPSDEDSFVKPGLNFSHWSSVWPAVFRSTEGFYICNTAY